MANPTFAVEYAEKHCVAFAFDNSFSHCMNCFAAYIGDNTCLRCEAKLEFGVNAGPGAYSHLASYCKQNDLRPLYDWYAVGNTLVRREIKRFAIDIPRRNRK